MAALENASVSGANATEQLCVIPVHQSDGTLLKGCLSTSDASLVVIIVGFALFTSYAVSGVRVLPSSLLSRLAPPPPTPPTR